MVKPKGIDDFITSQDDPGTALQGLEDKAVGIIDFFNPDHRHEIIRALTFIENKVEKEILTKAAAKAIGISADLLRKETSPEEDSQSNETSFPAIEPWSDPVDGAALLADISSCFERFAVLPEHGKVILALWTVHTYTVEVAQASPIPAIESPEKRCGKTTVMGTLLHVTDRAVSASNISSGALYRYIEKYHPTLLIDEADSFMKDNEELRGVVNSGHTRHTAFVIRCQGDTNEPTRFGTWGAKAIALIGKLPGTIEDRSIVIMMRRKIRSERIERMRPDQDGDAFLNIRRKCLRFANDFMNALRQADPPVPEALHDRAADNWRPLIAIADLAGGEWSIKARQAALALSGMVDDNEAAGILLLRDIHEYFTQSGSDRVLTAHLIEHLSTLEEHPWAGWNKGKAITPRQIAKLLNPFSIISGTIRIGEETSKGYLKKSFEDAFSRYLPSGGNLSVTPSQANKDATKQDFKSVTPKNDVTDKKDGKSNIHAGCDGVTDKKGGTGQLHDNIPFFDDEIIEESHP